MRVLSWQLALAKRQHKVIDLALDVGSGSTILLTSTKWPETD